MPAASPNGRGSAARRAAEVLLRAMGERDPYLDTHGGGVGRLALATGRRLGLEPADLPILVLGAELHDVGKLAIPDSILLKDGPLDDREWEVMRRHTIVGERILLGSPALVGVAAIVRSSHEDFDGGGYPDGLAGEQIPIASRIVYACDSYDAMTSRRPYARARSSDEALGELRRCAGRAFDPRVVEAVCEIVSTPQPAPAPAARACGISFPTASAAQGAPPRLRPALAYSWGSVPEA